MRPFDIAMAVAIALVAVFAVAWSPTNANSGPSGLVTQTPDRVLNTRNGPMPAAGSVLTVNTGRPGATAAVANLTSISATTPGQFLTAWASGPRPDTSVLNTGVGDVIANSIIVPLAPDGTFQLYTYSSAHLLVDISGYFDGGAALPPAGLTATITGYEQIDVLNRTDVLGTVGNGTSDDFRIVRVEVNCPGGELRTDQVVLGAFETRGFEVDCPGLHAGGATIRALVDI
jgi:hypothetical protein